MAQTHVTVDVIDSATPALKLAQSLLLGSKVEAQPFPAEAAVTVRENRPANHRLIVETLPSPAFLRWLADHIEADLAARG
jgi:hypothetical protein